MADIRRILCATDFSPSAKYVYEYAIDLAARMQAEIILIHAYQIPAYTLPDGVVEVPVEVEDDIRKRLAEQLENFSRSVDNKGVKVDAKLFDGVPYVEITHAARELKADLVVIGTHGRTGLAHLLLGSVAERVVRTCEAPVLTIRTANKT
ncbi:MAG: universal stress protein [Gammaproteobacteria bacterium]